MRYKLYIESLFQSIGFIIGAIVVVPLIFLLITKIFFQPRNNVTEEHIQQYMNESTQIQVQMPVYDIKPDLYPELFGNKRIIHFFSRRGEGVRNGFYFTFYSEEFEKYFTIWFLESSGFFFVRDNLLRGNKAVLTVNPYELKSSSYGTKETPIPILKVVGVDKPLHYESLDYDEKYMERIYYTNVRLYLGYEMPKKEFRQRFKKE